LTVISNQITLSPIRNSHNPQNHAPLEKPENKKQTNKQRKERKKLEDGLLQRRHFSLATEKSPKPLIITPTQKQAPPQYSTTKFLNPNLSLSLSLNHLSPSLTVTNPSLKQGRGRGHPPTYASTTNQPKRETKRNGKLNGTVQSALEAAGGFLAHHNLGSRLVIYAADLSDDGEGKERRAGSG
jgi:hypothetical protein